MTYKVIAFWMGSFLILSVVATAALCYFISAQLRALETAVKAELNLHLYNFELKRHPRSRRIRRLLRQWRTIQTVVYDISSSIPGASKEHQANFSILRKLIAFHRRRFDNPVASKLLGSLRQLSDQQQALARTARNDLNEAKDSWRGELGLIHEKLNRLGATEPALNPTPLTAVSFREYRSAVADLENKVKAALTNRRARKPLFIRGNLDEVAITCEVAELKIEEKELVQWIASPASFIAMFVPKTMSLTTATTLYIPAAIAILRYLETRHTKSQLHELRRDTRFIIESIESEHQAVVPTYWTFARELLTSQNPSSARLGLRTICSSLVSLRTSQINSAATVFQLLAVRTDGKAFSAIWMNRYLRLIERLADALMLEFFIRIALNDTITFAGEVVLVEIDSVESSLTRCGDVMKERLKKFHLSEQIMNLVSTRKQRQIARPLWKARECLKGYSRLLQLIAFLCKQPSDSSAADVLNTRKRLRPLLQLAPESESGLD